MRAKHDVARRTQAKKSMEFFASYPQSVAGLSIPAFSTTSAPAFSEVILKGTVRSWIEREEAERVAWSAPGVTVVDDRIVVSP